MAKDSILVINMKGENEIEKNYNCKFREEVTNQFKNSDIEIFECSTIKELNEALNKCDREKINIKSVFVFCLPGKKGMNINLLDHSLLRETLRDVPYFRIEFINGIVLYGRLVRGANYFFDVPIKSPNRDFKKVLIEAI